MSSRCAQFRLDGPAGELAGWTCGSRGDPVPVLFIHPINLQGSCWLDVAEALAPARFSLMPDLRGHGGSEPRGPFGVEFWTEDCLAVMDSFDIGRAHVVGGSLGGSIAVYLASHFPARVVSIAAVGSALTIEGADVESVVDTLTERGVQGMFRAVIPEISVAPGTDQEVIEAVLALTNPNDEQTVAAIWEATLAADVTDEAASVRRPAMVCSGEHDHTCPPDQGREMAGRLSTAHTILPGVGHLPMMENPLALTEVIEEHMATVGELTAGDRPARLPTGDRKQA